MLIVPHTGQGLTHVGLLTTRDATQNYFGYFYPNIVEWKNFMISQSAEYALRAMVVLLSREDLTLCSAYDIAARARVPVDYMAKILNALVNAGLVVPRRGR